MRNILLNFDQVLRSQNCDDDVSQGRAVHFQDDVPRQW
jgi:hypothetical protein